MLLPNWCSGENVKWLLATLAIPVTLAYLNHQYQVAETNREAITQRAQADRQL
jgi:hypothetical protein